MSCSLLKAFRLLAIGFACFLFGITKANSQSTIDTSVLNLGDSIVQYISILTDQRETITSIGSLIVDNSLEFELLESNVIPYSTSNTGAWLKFAAINSAEFDTNYLVGMNINKANEFAVYKLSDSGTVMEILSYNEDTAYNERILPFNQLAFPFQVEAGESATYFLWIRSNITLNINPVIYSESTLQGEQTLQGSILVVCTVFMFAVLLLNLANFVINKHYAVLIFSVRQVIHWVIILHVWGFAFPVLWPQFPNLNFYVMTLLGYGMLVVNLIFAVVLLNLKSHSFLVYRIALGMLAVQVGALVATPVIGLGNSNLFGTFVLMPVLIITLIAVVGFVGIRGSLLTKGYVASLAIVIFAMILLGFEYYFPGYLIFQGSAVLMVALVAEALIMSLCFGTQSLKFYFRSVTDQIALNKEKQSRLQLDLEKINLLSDIERMDNKLIEQTRSVSQISYSAKQPITTAQEALSSLKASSEDEQILSDISHSLNEISGLLSSSLDVDELGREYENVDYLPRVLKDVERMFKSQAERMQIRLRLVASSISLSIPVIPVKRIVLNILANALQHSKADKILIGVRRQLKTVEIWICDNGTGIDPGQQETAGDGLGMKVSQELCQRYCWELNVDSVSGKGTVFRISIPRGQQV